MRRLRSLARPLLALAASLVACLALIELLVRGVLLWGWFPEVRALDRLRVLRHYAHFNEDTYYELQQLVRPPGLRSEPPTHDPRLGWRLMEVEPGTYDHAARATLGDQRPVLLFGDSFANSRAGLADRTNTFERLFESTRLGARMDLVNYGTGGYGLDQICLLAELALPRWVERRPVVLMSLLIDDDLDRCRLAIRSWPKPRFRLVDGEPRLESESVPTSAGYMARHPLRGEPLAWDLLLHANLLPSDLARRLCGDAAADREVRDLCRALLERNLATLRALELPFGYVIFQGTHGCEDPETLGWRERLVVELLEREGVPYLLSRDPLRAYQREHGAGVSDLFKTAGQGRNHLNDLGNRVVLEGMVALIERVAAE